MYKLVVWLGLAAGMFSCAKPTEEKPPNIVIIVSDDHTRQAISAYGSTIAQTPNIDRIAEEGVLFTNAYVTNSICGPSRAVLLTGKYSHKNGFRRNSDSKFESDQDQFVKHLQAGGYQTAWIGKYHLGEDPQGFDHYEILPGQGYYYNPDFFVKDSGRVNRTGYVSDLVEDAAEGWLDRRDPEKPFCLVIGHKATHRTWMPDLQDLDKFDAVTFPLPANFYDDYEGRQAAMEQDMTVDKTMRMAYDLKMYPEDSKDRNIKRMTPEQRAQFDAHYQLIHRELDSLNLSGRELVEWKYQQYMRDYLATAESMDRNIGRTLDYLEAHGLDENTIVIYISDQGFYLGEHGWFDKRFMYEESFSTPMMMKYPGVITPGSKSDAMVMNLDIAPTVLDAANVVIPEDIQGESMLPWLTGPQKQGREVLYYHYYEVGEHNVSPHFGIKTDRYKLIRFYDQVTSWELFDLEKDPSEMQNVYGQERYQEVQETMKGKLLETIKKYEDAEAEALFHEDISTAEGMKK
ncbi:sulfatase family protein [Echinicola vietnamensis]|uniref:Arylsulfatase A family protein n=1 Tax=Echinicola vietnamensis (strain DSM 17526 / LMG 23754 / KMM 6221) TaxID=926556 RepID=L0G4G0_ECHVK|nr:sulfatase [Echinicola vietnamensis]AGA79901.1 arylsulfatase A family protein [Echinicola vietnamensis DSM 17526]